MKTQKFPKCEEYLGKPKHCSLIPEKTGTEMRATYLASEVELALSQAEQKGKRELVKNLVFYIRHLSYEEVNSPLSVVWIEIFEWLKSQLEKDVKK